MRFQFKDVASGISTRLAETSSSCAYSPTRPSTSSSTRSCPASRPVPSLPSWISPTASDSTDVRVPQAYEALILDALKGDHSNFVRDDELDVAWKIFTLSSTGSRGKTNDPCKLKSS